MDLPTAIVGVPSLSLLFMMLLICLPVVPVTLEPVVAVTLEPVVPVTLASVVSVTHDLFSTSSPD